MTTVTLDRDGRETTRTLPLPRRFVLSVPETEALFAATDAPLPWTATGPAGAPPAALATPLGDLVPEARDALAVFGAPEGAVDADLAVRRAGRAERLHSWQRWAAGRVTAVSTALHQTAELGWWPDARWQGELARLASVTRPAELAGAPASWIELPHELLLGAGAALQERRLDLFDELVARDVVHVRVDGEAASLVEAAAQLRLLESGVGGRLQVVVSGLGPGGRVSGWVSWLLYADGWRALEPFVRDGRPMVRVAPRRPLDLGVEVARLVTEVRS